MSIQKDLKDIDEVLDKTNTPRKIVKPKPPTLTEMIKTIGTRMFLSDENLKNIRDVLASVATESGKIYNHFVSDQERRERELVRRIESAERDFKAEVEHLKQQCQVYRQMYEETVRSNHFLRGRLTTLEQVAKIEPLKDPNGIENKLEPLPRHHDFQAPLFNR